MMLDAKFYQELEKEVSNYFEPHDDLHGWSHSQRVWNNSKKIAGLDANMDVVRLASSLHDIANPMEMRGEIFCHAEVGAGMAREILMKRHLEEDLIDQVTYAIKVHRVSKGLIPNTYESKVLQDADRLDALGAIIIARCFDHASQKKVPYFVEGVNARDSYDGSPSASTIHHMQEKILKLTPNTFHTEKARKIAQGRYKFVEQFVDRFVKEWRGEL